MSSERPYFLKPPQDQVVLAGAAVEFSCRVGGDPLPDVLWKRTGGNMPLGRVHVLEDRSLRLEHVSPDDAGEYSCEADNAVGSISAAANLTVHCKYSHIIYCKMLTKEKATIPLVENEFTMYVVR
jgi:roundabout axon guidance receptor 2